MVALTLGASGSTGGVGLVNRLVALFSTDLMEDVVDGGGGAGRMPVEPDVGIGGAGRMGTTATTGTTLSYDGGGVVDLLKKATLAAMLLVALVVVVVVVEVAVVSLPTAPVLVLTCAECGMTG